MHSAKCVIEAKKGLLLRPNSASAPRSKSTDATSSTRLSSSTLRSIGPVTRSLAAAARSAFSSATRQKSSTNETKSSTTQVVASTSRISTRAQPTNCRLVPVIRQSRPPTNPIPRVSKFNSKNTKNNSVKVETKAHNNVAISKDSVFSDEVDNDISWVIGSQYEFRRDEPVPFENDRSEKRRDPTYLQIAKVLNGYTPRRSSTSNSRISNARENCVTKGNGFCTPVRNSPLATTKPLENITNDAGSESSLEASDNGFCEGKSELEDCLSYSFIVPQFSPNLIDGDAYKNFVDEVLNLLKTHLKKCEILLENQTLLPESIAEVVRVVVGRTQLLMRKRLTQFIQQLERHLNPIEGEKLTTLNDLHGLWSLIDIQLDDIRQCFEQVDESRVSGWKASSEPKPSLTTASSMPSLRMVNKPTITVFATQNASNVTLNKVSADEAATRKATMEAKRREETRRRQEFLRAKRLAMSNMNNNNNDNPGDIITINDVAAEQQHKTLIEISK